MDSVAASVTRRECECHADQARDGQKHVLYGYSAIIIVYDVLLQPVTRNQLEGSLNVDRVAHHGTGMIFACTRRYSRAALWCESRIIERLVKLAVPWKMTTVSSCSTSVILVGQC